jgi:hypothetical protein
MPHIEKLADLLVPLLPIYPLTSPGKNTAEWQEASQYWSWRSGDATAIQMMQLVGMIDVGVETG